ncbi:MAG: cell division protein ZapA [Gemmatimonadetes bacterium]|nr:cell division protein ZapA [Gemmatimonadota bacterium]
MSETQPKSVVTVTIAGDEYTIRAEATPEYTRECATLVDRTISEILKQGSLVEAHKVAILAALSLSDQLLQARSESEALRREVARLAGKLAGDIESVLGAEDLASLP